MVALNAMFSKEASGQLLRALADTEEQGEALANLVATEDPTPVQPHGGAI